MRRRARVGLALALVLAAAAAVTSGGLELLAQEKAPPIPERLKDLGYLVGTWVGEGELEGKKYKDEFVYTWALNGTFLHQEYQMWMDGALVWHDEGKIGWDPEQKKIVGFNFGMDGSIGRGTEIESKGKDTLRMEGYVIGSPHAAQYRTELVREDNDHLTVSTEMRREEKEKWQLYGTMKYVRKKEEKKEEGKEVPKEGAKDAPKAETKEPER